MKGSSGKKSAAKSTAVTDVLSGPGQQTLAASQRLIRLERIAMALGAAHTMLEVADVIITEGLAALGGNAGSVALITSDASEFVTVRCQGYPPEIVARYSRYPYETSLPTADAARQGEPIFIETLAERDTRYPHLAGSSIRGGRGSFIALPLTAKGKVLGGLGLSFPDDRAFSDEERAFMQAIGQLCAQALDRARLYDEAQMEIAERQRVENALRESEERLRAALAREHQVAATLQRSLLKMPPDDAFPGLEIASRYESATGDLDVGGDFLDAFLLAPNRVALVVGDVSGKGLAAAASTSEVKYTLRALLREYQDPAMALTRLSVHLLQSRGLESAPSGFLALALIVVDTAAGEATFAVGGMEAPLVVGRNQVVRQVEIGGLPLGVLPYARYVSTMERLGPGDLLVITTDGIVEARRGQDFFGHEGLAETVAAARHIPALNEIADCILNTASRFAGGELRDDTAILLARLRDCNG